MPRPDAGSSPASFAPTRALRDFLATETAGGVLLAVATIVALVWANSPWQASYETLWRTDLGELDLRHWVNEGLMAVFFLVVGLEVKRELVVGELRDRRRAALPVFAAAGGMVVPALLYLALNPSGPASRGWGVPMATDIAFAVAVVALVAPAAPPALRLFLLTLAIVDDIGAILVIALFYSSGIDGRWLAGGLVVVGAVAALRRLGIAFLPVFVALGLVLWITVHASGVHATIAGVAMGLLVPTSAPRDARRSRFQLERLEHGLHGWSSFVIVPLFALANAGVVLDADALGDAATSTVTIGVVLGLVAGKAVGITLASWLATRLRLAELPSDVGWRQLSGAAALGGIGFTVSLFIAGLAFDAPVLVDEAKVGILAASVLATVLGAVLLRDNARVDRAPT